MVCESFEITYFIKTKTWTLEPEIKYFENDCLAPAVEFYNNKKKK